MVELTRTETVGEDGVLHLEVPGLEPGKKVEVMVRDGRSWGASDWRNAPVPEPDEQGRYRRAGGLEGKIRIANDFDDPLPEIEPYS